MATRDLERVVVDTTVQPKLARAKAGVSRPQSPTEVPRLDHRPGAHVSPRQSVARCPAGPRSSQSSTPSRPSTGWAAITSEDATAIASISAGAGRSCSRLARKPLACSDPDAARRRSARPKRPKECSSSVLHGRQSISSNLTLLKPIALFQPPTRSTCIRLFRKI